MEYMSVIKNELGEVMRYCCEYSDEDNEQYLEQHPEYYRSTIAIG